MPTPKAGIRNPTPRSVLELDGYAAARERRRLKRSIRPPLVSVRARPVYAGWQFKHTSTEIVAAVERMPNVAPHEEQRTSTTCKLGCCVTEVLLQVGAASRNTSPAAIRDNAGVPAGVPDTAGLPGPATSRRGARAPRARSARGRASAPCRGRSTRRTRNTPGALLWTTSPTSRSSTPPKHSSTTSRRGARSSSQSGWTGSSSPTSTCSPTAASCAIALSTSTEAA